MRGGTQPSLAACRLFVQIPGTCSGPGTCRSVPEKAPGPDGKKPTSILLCLGIKSIKLGPTLPAFVLPDGPNDLVENFHLARNTTAQQDLSELTGA